MNQTAYPGTQAVRRALGLLKAFTVSRPELKLSELARAAGLNKTTVFRLLSALELEGLIQRVPDGDAYCLGPELVALGSRALGTADLRSAARPELSTLAQETRETATVEILVGRNTLILDEAVGGHLIGAMPSIGTLWPAHATSTGKILLAFMPEEQRQKLLGAPLAKVTAKTLHDRAGLRRDLERVRDRGYATNMEELEPGFVAVGAPVRGADGNVVAAVSVGGPKTRLTRQRVVEIAGLLRPAVARISERLGYREETGRRA